MAIAALLSTAGPASAAGPRDVTADVRGDGTLVLTRGSDFTLPRSRQRQGRVVTSLSGRGTVKGAVTSEGVVLKVGGAVRLAGDLDMAAAWSAPAREITVLENTGKSQTLGTFAGLKEGARLELADTTYRIGYRGGDGNDVVLSAVSSAGHSPAARSISPSGPSVASVPRTANPASSGLGWWPYALAVGLLVGLVVPALKRREGRRRGGRHAAQG
ncbi:hypothetical protein [Streptomyces griseorubiginosus]|uniref:hypothetical protein n=1 Tax=Streptomyces griseorubiginosus TaxID=67304 RepID=UPI001AD76E73|nr:hypothetical protein [Streptomyces griseorubiginosus]